MNTETSTPPADDRLPAVAKRALPALVVGAAAAILDSTIVTIALGRLTTALGSSTATIQWVVTAYLLALTVSIPMSEWMQSRLGGKRAWITALVIFVTFSAACAGSWNAASLITFRVFQGFGAGLIFPLMQTLAVQAVGNTNKKVIGKAVTTISVPLALGPILGPVLGGVILNFADWRWMFLINVPLVAVGIVLAWRLLESDRPTGEVAREPLDVRGLILLGPALAGVLLGLSRAASEGGFVHADVVIPLLGGIALLIAFVIRGLRRRGHSIVDISLLRIRSLATASAVLFTAGATLYAGMVLLPLYWQQVRGASVLEAAMVLIPQGVGALFARVLTGMLTNRLGARAITVGAFIVTALGTVPFVFADADTSRAWLAAVLFIRGLGVGAVIMGPMMSAYADVGHAEMPHATMLTRITQQVGGSFGAAIAAMAVETLSGNGATGAFHGAFWWSIGITLVALLPALAFRRETLKEGTSAKG